MIFTPALRRHLDCAAVEVDGATVGAVLEAACRACRGLRDHLFEGERRLRAPVSVLVDGAPITDRDGLSDPVPADAEVYVTLEAPSGA